MYSILITMYSLYDCWRTLFGDQSFFNLYCGKKFNKFNKNVHSYAAPATARVNKVFEKKMGRVSSLENTLEDTPEGHLGGHPGRHPWRTPCRTF
jgi:hypothetical protein